MEKGRPGIRFWTYAGLLAFFAGGLIGVLGSPGDGFFTEGLPQLYYAVLVLCWMQTIEHRVAQRHIRRYILIGAGLMLLFLTAQEIKYCFSPQGSNLCRYMWYLYYIPMLLLPLMLLYTALGIGQTEEKLPRWLRALDGPALLFCAGILTNDLHQQAFRFPYGAEKFELFEYTRGWLYFAAAGWIVLLVLVSIIIILKKCRIPENRNRIALPVIWGCVCAAYMLYTTTMQFATGRKPYELCEVFCFMFVALWESCIQTSLIPANTKYGSFFDLSTVGAQITDNTGRVCFASENAAVLTEEQRAEAVKAPVMLDGDTRLRARPVRGGHAFWTEDMSAVNHLNEQLTEVRDQLSEYNVLLQAEAEAGARRIRAAEKNGIYDGIAAEVRSQLDRVGALLGSASAADDDLREKLGEACVLTAYIKRRANLMLLADNGGFVSSYELEAAVRESAEYLSLAGVLCDFRRDCEGDVEKTRAIGVYEIFEAVTEAALPGLSSLLIVLTVRDGNIRLRMTMDGENVSVPLERIRESNDQFLFELTGQTEDNTVFVSLMVGGEVGV